MLQSGRELIYIRRRNVHGHVIDEKRSAIASHGIPPHLNQKSLHDAGIVFLRSHVDKIAQRATEGKRLAIGPGTGHGIECVGKRHDAHRHGQILAVQTIGIARAIVPLVMVPPSPAASAAVMFQELSACFSNVRLSV